MPPGATWRNELYIALACHSVWGRSLHPIKTLTHKLLTCSQRERESNLCHPLEYWAQGARGTGLNCKSSFLRSSSLFEHWVPSRSESKLSLDWWWLVRCHPRAPELRLQASLVQRISHQDDHSVKSLLASFNTHKFQITLTIVGPVWKIKNLRLLN